CIAFHIEDAVDRVLAPEHRALRCDLRSRYELLGETRVAVRTAQLNRQLDAVENSVERVADLFDLRPDLNDGFLESSGIIDLETEIRGVGFHRFHPERVGDIDLRKCVIVKWIEGNERGHALRNRGSLLKTTPVLVLALEQTFERGRW